LLHIILEKKEEKNAVHAPFLHFLPPSYASSMFFSPLMCYNQPLPPCCLDRRNKQVTSPGEEYMIGGKEEKKECFAKL